MTTKQTARIDWETLSIDYGVELADDGQHVEVYLGDIRQRIAIDGLPQSVKNIILRALSAQKDVGVCAGKLVYWTHSVQSKRVEDAISVRPDDSINHRLSTQEHDLAHAERKHREACQRLRQHVSDLLMVIG